MHVREIEISMSLRNESRTARTIDTLRPSTDGGTPLAKSRAASTGDARRPTRADEKRAFLTRLERSRTSLFHGSD